MRVRELLRQLAWEYRQDVRQIFRCKFHRVQYVCPHHVPLSLLNQHFFCVC